MHPYFSATTSLPAAVLAGILAASSFACGPGLANSRRGNGETVGSCEVACDHYEYCKGTPDAAREQACLTECRTIFSEDGVVDGDSLAQLEELNCRQLLSFIEGSGSRPPGSPE
ncbi:MAG: hypothetical protein GY811_06315 [Myxococcales bacterium]|nr:hypothetical protein [Myxococcales bacterium]